MSTLSGACVLSRARLQLSQVCFHPDFLQCSRTGPRIRAKNQEHASLGSRSVRHFGCRAHCRMVGGQGCTGQWVRSRRRRGDWHRRRPHRRLAAASPRNSLRLRHHRPHHQRHNRSDCAPACLATHRRERVGRSLAEARRPAANSWFAVVRVWRREAAKGTVHSSPRV